MAAFSSAQTGTYPPRKWRVGLRDPRQPDAPLADVRTVEARGPNAARDEYRRLLTRQAPGFAIIAEEISQ